MQWKQLLQALRFRVSESQAQSTRTDFDRDYDRIVFSPAFRKLQDKTQVIPLPENDFVHTRLTHSIETSSVGRSLGRICGEFVLHHEEELVQAGFRSSDVGSIVAAACLAHDIGNPPFGHSGEAAISDYFLNGNGKQYRELITDDACWNDLIRFEGNANGFRLLTNYSGSQPGALRLTYPTLAAFSKYPKESIPVYPDKQTHEKKYGFFQSEKAEFRHLADSLQLIRTRTDSFINYARHPLAYLVEAADDICYHIIDFEDGLNLGWIDSDAADLLLHLIPKEMDKERLYRMIASERHALLRAFAIDALVQAVAEQFQTHEKAILTGRYSGSLLDGTVYASQLNAIKKLTREKVYRSRTVLEIEASGFEVIAGILDACITAVMRKNEGHKSYQSERIYDLIPEQFRADSTDSIYLLIMRICEFISGMTDRNAIRFYRIIRGIAIPGA